MTFQFIPSRTEDGATLLSLSGRLDSMTAPEFEQAIPRLFADAPSVVLMDMSQLDYISSAGLRVVLIAAKTAAQAQARLSLFGLQQHVREVFEISGFLKVLDVRADLSSLPAA